MVIFYQKFQREYHQVHREEVQLSIDEKFHLEIISFRGIICHQYHRRSTDTFQGAPRLLQYIIEIMEMYHSSVNNRGNVQSVAYKHMTSMDQLLTMSHWMEDASYVNL